MAKFSERIGITAPPALQLEGMTEQFRTGLWNTLYSIPLNDGGGSLPMQPWHIRAKFYFDRLGFRVDSTYDYYHDIKKIRDWFFASSTPWHSVFDFVDVIIGSREYLFLNIERGMSIFLTVLNKTLEEHNSGYRVVDGQLAPITNITEIDAINDAVNSSRFNGAGNHIEAAIKLLSSRPTPDYRNAIKESISAVESATKVITGLPKATLGDAIKVLKKDGGFHSALLEGFTKLYSYTSDEGGIRHGMMDDPNIGFDDAKFMLVICSAFVNYLECKSG